MNAIDMVLRHLDDAYGHAYESVRTVLEGVDDDAWAWQAPGYEDAPPEEVWPPAGTIAWHVVHLTACKLEYARHVRHRGGPVGQGDGPYAPPQGRDAVVAALEEAHAGLRREVAALEPADLSLKANEKMPLDEFLAMAIRHDTWHGGQIAVLRRLHHNR